MHTFIDTDIEKPIQACIHANAYVYRWAKLVHGCAPQVWYLGRVSGVLRDAKLIWLAQQPKYDEYIVPVIPDTSMPSSVGRTLAIDDRS